MIEQIMFLVLKVWKIFYIYNWRPTTDTELSSDAESPYD
jgi:hypothetical protein